jgi:hypothetical protein
MKTVYDKLKPDILASIKADEKTYPYTTKALSIAACRTIIIHSHAKVLDSVDIQDLWWGDNYLIEK